MKIRTGFVSNSSSSSFIVRFPKAVTCRQDVADALGECTASPYDVTIPTKDVVERVWKDLQALSKNPGKLYSEESFDEKPESEVQDSLWQERARQLLEHYCGEFLNPDRHDPIHAMVRGINGSTADATSRQGVIDKDLARKWYALDKAIQDTWRAPYKSDATPEERRASYDQAEGLRDSQGQLEMVVAKAIRAQWEARPGVTYVLSYCDEGGGYDSALEHGDIFRNLPNERISHH